MEKSKCDIRYEEVFSFLQKAAYAEGATKTRRRALRKQAKNFVLDHGTLFRVSGERRQQWVPDLEQQKNILKACHCETVSGGHFGRDKTRSKIAERLVTG